MNTSITTKTITKTESQTVNGFIVRNIDIVFNEKATFLVELTYSPEPLVPSYPVSTIRIVMEGDDYKNWGANDDYVINYITTYIQNMS